MRWFRASVLALWLVAVTTATAGDSDVSGFVGIEGRWFVDDPQFGAQLDGGQASLIVEPTWEYESGSRRHQVTVTPFLRLDSRDDDRSHVDLREAYWRFLWSDWELLTGVAQVFWGVTESRHLVDVVNQRDAVEDVDEEDKLGQPMVQLALQKGWGRLEGFLLTGFRERTFAGREGRLRPPLPVDEDATRYESSAEERRIDLALRYSHFVGDWDIGAHWFHGTGREPGLRPGPGGETLVPFYRIIQQVGVDVQLTREAWLWKLEALGRKGQGDTFGATVGGFEYTFYQVGNSAADVGLLAEYLYDGRDETAPVTPFDDDVFVGSRLAVNDPQDTQLLLGAVVDRDDGSVSAFLEAERRIGDRFKLELETRWFMNVDRANPLTYVRDDSFITLRFSRHF